MTAFASFVASISGLVITGVETLYDYTPESLGNADLPAQFPRLPSGDAGYAPADCDETEMVRTIELVICIKPGPLESGEQNFGDTVTMLDDANTAISAWVFLPAQDNIAVSYSLSTSGDTPIVVGDTAYWGIIATVVGRG